MVLTKYTGIQTLTGSEAEIFNVNKGPSTIHFGSSVYLDELVSGDTVRVRVYDKKDGVGFWKFDGEVNDYVGSNNGTITYHASLAGLYKFEQVITDSTTNANNLSLTAGTATYVSAKEGSGFSFDGSSYLSTSGSTIYNYERTQALSFSFWINTTQTAGQIILGKGITVGGGANWGIYINSVTTGKITFEESHDNTGTNILRITSATSINDGNWHYVTITYAGDSNASNCKIYIDGVSDSFTTNTNTLSASILNGSTATVGARSDAAGKYTGLLDELRIYTIQLTSSQASALYMVGKYGQSHTFDGGEYVSVGNPTALQFERTNTFTFVYWSKYTNTAAEKIITKNNGDGTTGYAASFNSSAQPRLRLINTASTNEIDVHGSSTYNDGLYHHFVWTYDGSSSASGVILYVDGVSVALTTTTNNLSATISNSNNVTFGADGTGATPLTAQLDDIRIYNRVLSSSEVSDLYNNPQNLNSIVYDKQYSGPQSSKTLYIPIIQTNNYAVTLQQTAGNYYKTLDWSRIEIT